MAPNTGGVIEYPFPNQLNAKVVVPYYPRPKGVFLALAQKVVDGKKVNETDLTAEDIDFLKHSYAQAYNQLSFPDCDVETD